LASELRERLQESLGRAYAIDRELGGGGMSRVFVADETALGRKVVVKVLPPELAAGVNVDRFKREIQVAARLQHPHIVPVLSAGEFEGLPFYTMPLVDGSSVRARLANGPLSITEAVNILREVARALAYAHANGVVHRDIKPDNVLLTGGSATVTDFGIAKALSDARDEGPGSPTLTAMGTSLGTPTYMAPEQAAGDPSTNHRADLYSFGCMAYELLTGHPPFAGLTPHKLFAAHMGERPVPVNEVRPDTPPALADVVMLCLEKEPDNRPQSAAEVVRVLDTVTSSGTGQVAMPAVLLGGRGMLGKALATYAAAFIVVAVLAKAAIVGIGLPDWVFPGALLVMGLGLPVILFTAFVQKATRRALTATPTLTPGGSPVAQGTMATIAVKAAPHMSWRRTALGGAMAVGAFVLLVGGWMLMRALGIGPAASLMASGKLSERDRVILTEFRGPPTDTLLGPTVTEAFRTDLAQSQSLSVLPVTAVREALQRMQRPIGTRVDYELAREIASREGIKAVVDGEVVTLGGAYVLSARLIAAQTGNELASFRETADNAADIIPAISRLSKKLRERTGESLKAIQNARSLERVTTPSLQALQKYVAGVRTIEEEGDWNRGRSLIEEAISLDTGFAMAYRKLAAELNNRFYPRPLVTATIQKAYDHRDRLSEAERYLTIAGYYHWGPKPDRSRIISAYESLLEIDPNNVAALNNLAVQMFDRRDFARAEELAKRAIALQSAAVFFNNALWSQMAQGKMDEAEQTLQAYRAALPRNPFVAMVTAMLHWARGDYRAAEAVADSLRRARINEPSVVQNTDFWLGMLASTQGRLGDARRRFESSTDAQLAMGVRVAQLQKVLDEVWLDAWFRGNIARAKARLEEGMASFDLDSLQPIERPFDRLVELNAMVGNVAKARDMLAAFDRRRADAELLEDELTRHAMLGHIALAEQRYDEAIKEYTAANADRCGVCFNPEIARAYDLAGRTDSALAVLERYIQTSTNPLDRSIEDGGSLAGSHKRLAELYDAKGDREKALSHYSRFIELWKSADPDLQPHVLKARERVTQLQRAERK
jgi:tetratricopeptide (TPR) repeat protein/tRNA A-37 threonylcarbamoyl transferase component Bud32